MEEELDEMEEMELDVSGNVFERSDATEDGDDATAKMKQNPAIEEKEKPEIPLILG